MMSQRVKSYLREVTEDNYLCYLEDSDRAAQLAATCFLNNKINEYKDFLIKHRYNQYYNFRRLRRLIGGSIVAVAPLPIINDGRVEFPVDCFALGEALKGHWDFDFNPRSISLIVDEKKVEAHCYPKVGPLKEFYCHNAEILVYENVIIPFKFFLIEDYSSLKKDLND